MTRRPVISLQLRPAVAADTSPSHPEERTASKHPGSPAAHGKAPSLKTRGTKTSGTEHAPETSAAPSLSLPHERDESAAFTAAAVDPVMAQAKRDIDAGLVDTDMRATPGLDAALRSKLVPGPGGKPPRSGG